MNLEEGGAVVLESDGSESPVKESCWSQREALPGEPRCAICGRYGEYICDETDDDVCSLQCKKLLLDKLPIKKNATAIAKLPALDKCFYVGDRSSARSESLFSDWKFNLPRKLLENLKSAGFEIPTAVQKQVIPAVLDRKNLLVSAETGSGKTISFLVPLVARCAEARLKNPEAEKKAIALVLEPTRELCVQVEEQAKLLGKGLPFKTALVVGGDAAAGQVYRLSQGIEMIIATPGRLIDLLVKHPTVEIDEISVLVLDEVDCMLQSGFLDQVMQIFQALSQPQVLMFSATVTDTVNRIASDLAKDLVIISEGRGRRPSESVAQIAIWVGSKNKKKKLFEILKSEKHFVAPAMVFVESRMGAELLSEAITVSTGLKALAIHGEKEMKERREIMRVLLAGEVEVVVATGVLGRGVDLCGVRLVIIFDLPNSMDEYVHLVGRASRRGEKGTAIVLVSEEDKRLFKDLVSVLKASGAQVPRELAGFCQSMEAQRGGSQKKRKVGVS
ncbi:P-loop containing nucleoside triphosphate hydrolases superfamily protein [Wolffia australiana]